MARVLVGILLLCAAQSCQSAGCSENFRVFEVGSDDETEREVTSHGICVEEYMTKECKEFVDSFNRSLLPQSLQGGSSVERPSKIDLDPMQSKTVMQGKDYYVPGVTVLWDSPFSGNARESLKGFVLSYGPTEGNVTQGKGCRLFKLDSDKMSLNSTWPKLRFSYKLQYVIFNNTLLTTVHSIPTPPPSEREQPGLLQQAQVKTNPPLPLGDAPGWWVPSVSLQARSNGRLDVGVSLGPPEYNLTSFLIKLVKHSEGEMNTYKEFALEAEVASPEKSSAHYIIEKLEVDVYRVVVRPIDTFREEKGRCLCWEHDGNERLCRNTCNSIQTVWVNLTDGYVGPTSPPTSPSTSTTMDSTEQTSPPEMTAESPRISETGEILAVVLGVVFAVIVLIMLTCVYRHKGILREKFNHLVRKKMALPASVEKTSPWPGTPNIGSPEVKGHAPLSVKTIYLLYHEDHQAHIQLLDCLAKFLDVHCNCRVVYRPWCEDVSEQGGLAWVSSNINNSDLVLFVASQGAEKLLEAQRRKMTYRSRRVGPEGDLFMLGVQRLLTESGGCGQWSSVVPVHFGETRWCQQQMLFPVMYELPSHLPEMVQKIHRLSPSTAKAHSTNLPLSVAALPELPEGAQLLEAITAARQYEVAHPNWFDENFGGVTPIMATTPSISHTSDSDYGSLGPILSVSSQDVSTSDYMVSPASMLDYPDFRPYLHRYPSIRSNPDTYSYAHQYDLPKPRGSGSQRLTRPQKEYVPSVVTLPSEEDPLQRQENGRIRPPEVLSEVGTEVMNSALRNFNSSNDWFSPPASQPSSPTSAEQLPNNSHLPRAPQGIRPPMELNNIKAPQPCSDVSSDCMSLAFQQINAASDTAFRDQPMTVYLEDVTEEESSQPDGPEFDAVSV